MTPNEKLDNWASTQENAEQLKRYIAIGKANALVGDMEKEVEKYTKLLELAKQDQVYVVTHNVNYFNYLYAIPSAKEFFYKKDENECSKEYKENKACFDYVTKMLNELFDISAEIVNFSQGEYEGYYQEIDSKIDGNEKTFTFTIPNTETININNFHYAFEGKLAIGETTEHCHNIIKTSYDIEEIKSAFKEMIKEK